MPTTPLSFHYLIGGAAPRPQAVNIGGTSGITYTASNGGVSWLSATSGTVPGSMTVSVNPSDLPASTYTGSVTVTSPGATGSPATVPVTLTVTQPALTVAPLSLNFSPPPNAQAIQIGGTPGLAYTAQVTPSASWLSISPALGTVPGSIEVSVNPAGLAPSLYSTTIVISASNVPTQNVTVSLTVGNAATISVAPTSLLFNSQTPQTITISSGQPGIAYTISSDQAWLSASPNAGDTRGSASVTVTPGALTSGTGHLTITASAAANSPLQVPVTLNISTGETISANQPSITVLSVPGSGPSIETVEITSTPAVPTALTASVTAGSNWLVVTPLTATTPASLTLTVTPGSLTAGCYNGSVSITGAGANTISIPVTLVLGSGPVICGITDSAGYETNAFAPGIIFSIFGLNMGPDLPPPAPVPYVLFTINSDGLINDTLAGVSVSVDGVPAIPLMSYAKQINAILPFSASTSGTAEVVVNYQGNQSQAFSISMAQAAVRLFTANASGVGPAAALNQDSTINTATNPADKGSIVQLFGTGAGAVNPAVVEGGLAGTTLCWVTLIYSATVSGENATVYYAGTAPTLVYGAYQFNVRLPADVATGSAEIVLTVGNSQNQPGVTVYVK